MSLLIATGAAPETSRIFYSNLIGRENLTEKGYFEFVSSCLGKFLSGVFMDYAKEVRKVKM